MERLLQNLRILTLLIFAGSTFTLAQNNINTTCAEALPVCPDNNFGRNIVSEVGDDITGEVGPDYGCLGSEPNPLWYYMRVSQTGTAIFDLEQWTGEDQTGELIDVDFAVWGPFDSEDNCENLTTEMLVDSSYDPTGDETIDFYNGDGCGAEPTENAQVVNAGEVYILVITNFSRRAGFINLIPREEMTATFDCSILGPSYEFCDYDGDGQEAVDLNNYINEISEGNPNVAVTFHPTSQDAYNYTNFIDTNQTLTSDPLTVYARKEDVITGEVTVIVISFALIPEPELQEATLTACDSNGDGVELFDLTQGNVIVNEEDEMTLSYYLTQEDADNAENAIEDPTYYTSGTADIIVRADAGDCYATTILHLELIDTLELMNASSQVCDTNNDGVEIFDLTEFNSTILNNNTGTIRYYENESDALAGNDNYIQNLESYETGSTILYAHVAGESGCNATATLEITLNPSPELAEGLVYDFCDISADNTETIDLSAALSDLVDDATGLTVWYFDNETDAANANADNALENVDSFELTENTTIWILVQNENECSAYQSVAFNLLEGVEVMNAELLVCGDGTGNATYDLTDANVTTNGESIIYYPTEEDATNGTNAIENPTAYTAQVPTTVYAVVSIGDCSETAMINLNVFEDLQANPYEYSVCDEDGNDVETFDLNDFIDEIAGNDVSGDVFFYENEADAQAGNENYIQNPESYETATVTLYVLVTSGDCSAMTTLTLNVLDAPQAMDVEQPYAYCDNFNDGMETVDLTVAFDDVVASTTGLTAEYYLNENDANEGNTANAIENPESYELIGTTVIYVRVYTGDCSDVAMVTFELTDGIAVTDDTLFACFDNAGNGTFDLTSAFIATAEIITHHTTEADAMTGDNPISNPTTYTSTVPGMVYVYVNSGDCTSMATINLEYFAQPEINIPDAFAICSGYSAQVDAGAGFAAYNWSTGENTQTIEIEELGNYWVDVTDTNGCTFRHNFEVIAGVAPTIVDAIVGQDMATIMAEGGEQPYQYSIGGFVWQDSNVFTNLNPGTYNIFVRGADGCISSIEIISVFEWPTLFTPNGDGQNDMFNVPGMAAYPGSYVRIYDRYGALMHEGEVNGNAIWDGKDMSGNIVPTQDYWYILDVTDGRRLTGHITVKRRTEKGQ